MNVNASPEFALQHQQHARTGSELPPTCRGEAIAPQAAPRFTPRQLDVLTLLCEGLPNKRISSRLNISAGTVKIHISQILRKLGVASRLQAVIVARRRGVIG